MAEFDWGMLSDADRDMAKRYIHKMRDPDLVIAPDGTPYLYRWHLQSGEKGPGMYFHIQVQSDPERPLHTHPWDNCSVILAGAGYIEVLQVAPPHGLTVRLPRMPGDVIFRRASEAHRLLMPVGGKYTMTQFAFGPKINNWGFWYPDGFRRYQDVTQLLPDGRSVHKVGTDANPSYPPGAIPGCCMKCGAPDTGSRTGRCLSNPHDGGYGPHEWGEWGFDADGPALVKVIG